MDPRLLRKDGPCPNESAQLAKLKPTQLALIDASSVAARSRRDIAVLLPPSYTENTAKAYTRVHVQWDGSNGGAVKRQGVDDPFFRATVDAATLEGAMEEVRVDAETTSH